MEIRGTPDVKSRDFADWERLAAELPEIYDQQHPGNSRPDSPESASSSNLEQVTDFVVFLHFLHKSLMPTAHSSYARQLDSTASVSRKMAGLSIYHQKGRKT